MNEELLPRLREAMENADESDADKMYDAVIRARKGVPKSISKMTASELEIFQDEIIRYFKISGWMEW